MSRQSLIFSRSANNGVMSAAEVLSKAPAVFATTKADRLTDRYVPLHTSDLIPIMADYGYFITQAAQKRSRKHNPEHAAHLLAFSKLADIDEDVSGVRPEIIMYNSHDGTSGVKLFAGAYRFICSNGIIAGDGFRSSVHHSRKGMAGFEDMLRNTVDKLPEFMSLIDKMRGINLSRNQQWELAKLSAMTRWSLYDEAEVVDGVVKAGAYATSATVDGMLTVHRSEDEYQDAWTVFNRIQENVLRGKAQVLSVNKDNVMKMRKARPITNVSEHTRINAELFGLMDAVTA